MLSVTGGCLCLVPVCNRWLSVTGGIYIPNLLFQCLEMLFTELIHPVFAFLKRKDYYSQPDSSLQTESPRQGCIAPGFFIPADRIFSAGMHRPGIFHPCGQNLLGRDASTRDFSSLQTKSLRQGCIDPGFFIPPDKISSPGMHRPRIFHPCRQNLLVRDASPRDFSSLQKESSHQGCIASAIIPPRLPDAPSPDKADSSDFQTAGFPDDLFYFLNLRGNKTLFLCFSFQFQHVLIKVGHKQSVLYHAVLFKFSFRMKPGNFSRHPACIL